MYEYKAIVKKVVDGDTIDVIIDLGFNIGFGYPNGERLRLYGVDTPETRTKNKKEKAKGLKAKVFVKNKIEGKKILIKTDKDLKGKFGRYLAKIYYPIGNNIYACLNKELIDKKLAKEYYGGKK